MTLGKRALIVVDVQNDFLPGGALAVPQGDLIVPAINDLMKQDFAAVIASRDWHPAHHCSFLPDGGLWPAHCVAGTRGADFAPSLDQSRLSHIVHKGMDRHCDSYSAFFDNDHVSSTGLDALLRGLGIERITLCGLALDFCVSATARDARRLGFETTLIEAACRGIAQNPSPALDELRGAGVHIEPL